MPLPKKIPRSKDGKGHDSKRVLANRYRVEKKLGSGNFGTAWLVTDLKCKDPKEQQKVLKEISVGDLQPDETVDAMHEANLLRNLDHPGIVKFHDSFIDQENFCIITEYCEGGDLDHKIVQYKKQGKTFPEGIVIEWLIQLLLAVQYMHSRRVLHRDLKTRNIFLRHNMIKIGDFGISRILMGTTDLASTFTGTPYYMSPEVLKHEGYNSKSDVWSVGCMLYELVSLKHAFEGQSLMGVMYKIVEGDLPGWPEEYSQDLHHVFQSILEKDPAERPSASEVLKIPFIARQMEVLKNTMMDKHFAKEEKDSINQESQEIVKALKKKSRKDQLQKESEDVKWKNMSPRERMRLRKQQKADEEARKLHGAALQQRVDNTKKYNEIRDTMNAYKTHAAPWLRRGDSGDRLAEKNKDAFGLGYQPFQSQISEYDDSDVSDDEDDYDDDEDIEYGHSRSLSLHRSFDDEDRYDAHKYLTVDYDDRPITPMRDKMVYNVKESSLDFKDGVPDNPELAETYYSQFDDEFEDVDEEGDAEDGEGTLLATVLGAASNEATGDDEVGDLIQHMQSALSKDDTVKSATINDDTYGAFGPKARELRIHHLRAECEKKLGKKEFNAAYDYLKEARFSRRRESVDEARIMKDLKQFVRDPSDCFMVDQLLFLEEQAKL